MGRRKKIEVSLDETPQEAVPLEVQVEEPKIKGGAFDVLNRDSNVVRTYLASVHGAGAVKLAEEYAAKIHGSVRKL